MSSESREQRISITGVPNESLSGRYFFDENESPTLGHLHALLNVANGKLITGEIEEAILDTASRHKPTLKKEVDEWNREVGLGLGEQALAKFLAFSILLDAIALSYGSRLVDPHDRRMLILSAVNQAGQVTTPSRN